MKAIDARKIARESKIDSSDIYLAVKKAAEAGNYSVNVFRILSDVEISELKSFGYKIQYFIDLEEKPLTIGKGKPVYKLSWEN